MTIMSDPTIHSWSPQVGEETWRLMQHIGLPPDASARLESEAMAILGRCVPATGRIGQGTGLVIGYVQSGKTMSFTTVAALARDNGYRLIIVISGLTTNLFDQSSDRLARDLQVSTDRSRWLFHKNPRNRPEVRDGIQAALDSSNRVVLLTVMKNGARLEQLRRLLQSLPTSRVPTLVIDDEADQASLNTEVRAGGQSATYRRLVTIRQLLPHHTYLQYTATPQAPLLINLIDVLSPRFVEVLTPGEAYTGGQTFFGDSGNLQLIKVIPDDELPASREDQLGPPDTLLHALRVFFLTVAAGRVLDGGSGNRSMMIHPSMERSVHERYFNWTRSAKHSWARLLSTSAGGAEPDYLDLVKDFGVAYEDLAGTVDRLPPFDQLMHHLKETIAETIVVEVNSGRGRTPQIDWSQHYAHILVGGEVLNRGFTVEGLTVSYMPRGLGVGQADTVQQRARWFGYKEEYLGFCRVYLSSDVLNVYRGYVDHEERLREDLRQFGATGKPLTEWRRAFFIDASLKPTRDAVLTHEYHRGNFAHRWFTQDIPHEMHEAVEANRRIVEAWLSRHEHLFVEDAGSPQRTQEQRHAVALNLCLGEVFLNLLAGFQVVAQSDSAKYTGLLLQVARYLEEHPDASCRVYAMSGGRPRQRSVDDTTGKIKELFQGRSHSQDGDGAWTYPGDDQIRSDGELSIQLHRLDILQGAQVVAREVPTLAVWVPRQMGADWLTQGGLRAVRQQTPTTT